VKRKAGEPRYACVARGGGKAEGASAKPELLPWTMRDGAQAGERQRSFPRSAEISSGNDMYSAAVAYCTVAEILSWD